MQRKIFFWQWVRQGDYWILHNGVGRAVGMILIVDELEEQPVFHLEQGRVTV